MRVTIGTDEQINYLKKYCKKNNKYISGGTDYHGSNRPNVSLGTGIRNKFITDENIEKWIKENNVLKNYSF